MNPRESLRFCAACGAAFPLDALSCPQCHTLRHAEELEGLARRAHAAAAQRDFATERRLWEQALTRLPAGTVQYRSIQSRLSELPPAEPPKESASWKKVLAGAGPAAFVLWKLKTVILLVLTKGKILLLGFTKFGTLFSMFASLGVYWAIYGWWLALGIILSIYIHEMGHVTALRRLGIPAGAPMFIPGIGAFIRLRALHLSPVDDARIGLAGPFYGLGAALACWCMYTVTQEKLWAVIAHFGAVINLFNLIPVWQLDGARGLRSLTRQQRGIVLATAAALWWITSGGMLLLVAAGVGYRMFTKDWAPAPDRRGLLEYVVLLVALAVVMVLAPLGQP